MAERYSVQFTSSGARDFRRLPLDVRRQIASCDAMYGGADRDRTDDLRLAKPALSQLSYSPISSVKKVKLAAAPRQRGYA